MKRRQLLVAAFQRRFKLLQRGKDSATSAVLSHTVRRTGHVSSQPEQSPFSHRGRRPGGLALRNRRWQEQRGEARGEERGGGGGEDRGKDAEERRGERKGLDLQNTF